MFIIAKSESQSAESNGGAEEDRTPDPLLAKQVLSQLSYSPLKMASRLRSRSLDIVVYHERATSCESSGGPKRIRTSDPSLIRAVL